MLLSHTIFFLLASCKPQVPRDQNAETAVNEDMALSMYDDQVIEDEETLLIDVPVKDVKEPSIPRDETSRPFYRPKFYH